MLLTKPVEAGGFGFAPSEVKRLTLYQFWFYITGGKQGGIQRMSPEEARKFVAERKRQKQQGS